MFRRIFTNKFLVIFIYVPIIAQASLFLCFWSSTELRIGGLNDAKLLLMSVIFAPVPLSIFGYFWAKKIEKEVGFATKFLLFAFPIYILVCANLAFLLSHGDITEECFVIIAAFSNPLFFMTNIFFVFFSQQLYLFFIHLYLYVVFSVSFILGLRKNGLKLRLKYPKILALIILILFASLIAQTAYRNSHLLSSSTKDLASVNEDVDYFRDADAEVTPLRGEPTLRFIDELPKLNAATALCPLSRAAYKAIYPKVENRYEIIMCSGTESAYYTLMNNQTELIFAAAPSDALREQAREKGVEFILTPIGKEAFVFLTNRENTVTSLSIEQIRKIYSGKITSWREVGGANEKILAFQRNPNSGSQSAMENFVMKGLAFKKPIKEEFYGHMGGMIEGVADYRNAKNALGYSFRYYATIMDANNNIRLLDIEGVTPNLENIANDSYPFAAPFYIVTRKDRSPNARKLIDWFLSEQGQNLILDSGYTPIKSF